MYGGGNLGGLGTANVGNTPVIAKVLPAFRNSANQNQNQSPSKIVNRPRKDPQLTITVG